MEEVAHHVLVLPQREVVPMAKKNKKVTSEKRQNSKNGTTANRKYKDTVFRRLFSERDNLLSLYNAVNGTAYTDPSELEIVTLESAIYMGMKNDLAFIIDTNLFLYEHQSTYNPNMPLRDLLYISSEYQKLVDDKSLYSSALQRIPAPNFIVFYNGEKKEEDSWVNYLSEAYETQSEEPSLELRVITFNINDGHNKKLMEQCHTLREYAQYVAKVRKYRRNMNLDAAVERAVDECIQEGILDEFLRKHRSEVIGMSIFEYNKEEEERKLRKAEYEAGYDSGYDSGKEAGYDLGRKEGIEENMRKIVCAMLASGETLEKIAQYTGYSVQEIEKFNVK